MALTKKQKQEKEALHMELRHFLQKHRIPKKVAAQFFEEEYNSFITCLKRGVFSNEKITHMVSRKNELKQHTERLFSKEFAG